MPVKAVSPNIKKTSRHLISLRLIYYSVSHHYTNFGDDTSPTFLPSCSVKNSCVNDNIYTVYLIRDVPYD
uniref:Uncharacterized protein n=1 Tax=Schistosoma haematobium TaxID=6185 RepID=A0A094ZSV7_SCHHA